MGLDARSLWTALGREPVETRLAREVYLRALAVVHLVAVGGLWWQIHGLIGADGILPFTDYLERVTAHLGAEGYLRVPTALWLAPVPWALDLLCAAGIVLSLLVVLGIGLEGWWLLGLWGIYLSLSSVGQVFLSFQWDTLLVEVTFASLFVARFGPGNPRPPRWGWWVSWFVLARLMFFGGLVKLTSGDPTWRDLTALTYHYWTQPLPGPTSWGMHHLPLAFHKLSVVLTFLIELGLPFFIVLGRRPRLLACGGFLLLLGMLAGTGNYGWFQVLSAVLCLSLVDDAVYRRVLPNRLRRLPEPTRQTAHVLAPVGVCVFALGLSLSAHQLGATLPSSVRWVVETSRPFRTVNTYGLFARMTTTRPEIELQVSADGVGWAPLPFRYKPGDPARRSPQVAPYHPRLDWQMWFAALGTCERNPWVVHLLYRIAEGSEPVLDLLGPSPLDRPPAFVRAVRYDYRFSGPGADAWWLRTERGLYCPVVRARP